jgi:hypothetical protein
MPERAAPNIDARNPEFGVSHSALDQTEQSSTPQISTSSPHAFLVRNAKDFSQDR